MLNKIIEELNTLYQKKKNKEDSLSFFLDNDFIYPTILHKGSKTFFKRTNIDTTQDIEFFINFSDESLIKIKQYMRNCLELEISEYENKIKKLESRINVK